MDETNTRWYQWIADHAQYFFWALWGAGLGAFCTIGLSSIEGFEFFDKHSEAVTALFTIVLAISTIGLWSATRRLWLSGEKQIRFAQAAATAATLSASAAQASVDEARKTAQAQLRAYITITKHKALHYRLWVGHVIVPCFTIKNRGQTHAHDVRVTIMARYDSPVAAKTLKLASNPSPTFTLAPGEKSTFTADLPSLDEQLIADLENGTKVLILLGEVLYTDAFGFERMTRMRASSNHTAAVDDHGHLQLEWHGSDNDAT